MQQQLGMDLGGATLCYPRWLPAIEDESLQMLGLGGNPIIDTAREGGVSADTVYASRLPGWYQIHTGARLLRDRLISFAGSGRGNRIYVSRAGRRRIFNEEEVRQCLESRGFTIIEDQPRSLRKQISIFQEAEVIVAPHGAALANILWCRPNALVVELADSSYYPHFYKNLAGFTSLIHQEVISGRSHFQWTNMGKSFGVDSSRLQALLDANNIG
jgi:capsular polysaccharide biosynthesis protein